MIQCTSPCLYEKEGECTLTYVTSVSNPQKECCIYFKNKLIRNLRGKITPPKFNKDKFL